MTLSTYDLMVSLAACIETTFDEEQRPAVCFNGVIMGDGMSAAWAGECDNGLCGMTWVRLVNIYPADSPGAQNTQPANCSNGLGAEFEVGVLRCTPIDATDAEEEEADSLQTTSDVLADMVSLRKALLCCTDLPKNEMVLGNWTPMGPLGGLVGGAWLLYAMVGD